jgi:energy-coupling factor transporter ATP-binding protein EcfA2
VTDPSEELLFEPPDEELPAIASIHIERLHGKFSYNIDLGVGTQDATPNAAGQLFAVSDDRLTLLYGNNGTGKTSLLRLVFHALSASEVGGHRKAIEATRFEKLVIRLTNGVEIRYVRTHNETLVGAFRAEIATPDPGDSEGYEVVVSWDYFPEGDPRQLRTVAGYAEWTTTISGQLVLGTDPGGPFLAALQELRLNPVFLSDSRAITADVLDGAERSAAARQAQLRRGRVSAADDPLQERRRYLDVEDALQRVRTYLSQLVFTGTQAGSQRVDTVYVNVATAIIQHTSKVGRPNKQIIPSLRARLLKLAERVRPYNDYALLPELPTASLLELLEGAPDRNGPVLQQVLVPYLDGLDERMDALEPGLRAISSFVEALNSFLERKRAYFRTGQRGVFITDADTEEQIRANELSSGEKQIVLLFSDIVALQGQTRLFLIDEPELSLNPQWQRQLMPRLLEFTEGSEMQLLAATHSIEIMAKYRRRIRRLQG